MLEGWAASLDDAEVESVEIEVDGRSYHCATGIARPDVSAAFADARLAHAGWRFQCEVGPAQAARIAVSARTRQGETALLYVGTLQADEGVPAA